MDLIAKTKQQQSNLIYPVVSGNIVGSGNYYSLAHSRLFRFAKVANLKFVSV
jgi:hypothetical protein|tara:strand:+ start:87 stop:242 length:156 start_codon:yes stop_codon:yes gene_type:complete